MDTTITAKRKPLPFPDLAREGRLISLIIIVLMLSGEVRSMTKWEREEGLKGRSGFPRREFGSNFGCRWRA
jgi:hypothetical protein